MKWTPKKTTRFDCAAKMPYLRHSSPAGQPFSCMNSEVAAWLVAQPDIRQFVFDRCKDKGLIVFNKATGMWHGKDTKGELEL